MSNNYDAGTAASRAKKPPPAPRRGRNGRKGRPATPPLRRQQERQRRQEELERELSEATGGQQGGPPVQQFSYSVRYFNWALSSEEDEGDEDEQTITLPLKSMSLRNK